MARYRGRVTRYIRAVLRAARATLRPVLRVARATLRPVLRAARATLRPVLREARVVLRAVVFLVVVRFFPVFLVAIALLRYLEGSLLERDSTPAN